MRRIEFTSLLFMELTAPPEDSPVSGIRVQIVTASEAAVFCSTSLRGWTPDNPELEDLLKPMMEISCNTAGFICFIAELDARPVATGALNVQNGVTLLSGASTVPQARPHGAQHALLTTRLRYAAEAGCDTAPLDALPGSPSQRNAGRAGFRIACTRTKWCLQAGTVQ
jgi:hypothetical protein